MSAARGIVRAMRKYSGSVARTWRRPSWAAVVLACAGLVFFLGLGCWQVDRAHQKERLFAAFAGAHDAPPIPLAEARRVHVADERHPHVGVTGHYDARHGYLLDNQFRGRRVGIVAYAPFLPADGSQPLLVARGWLAREPDGKMPRVPPVPRGEQYLRGLYAPPPGSGLRLGNALPNQPGWPKTVLYIDTGEVGADMGRTLDERILQLDPDASSAFVRDWRPQVFPPARHYGYAFTWFAFALLTVGLFVGMHWRRRDAA
jgi:cytochrome oxidase assembly protein ShyY1